MSKTITAELGSSGEFVDFELTDDAKEDVKKALDLEHMDGDFDGTCDICGARREGFVFAAAHLLLGATETPLLDTVVKHHREEMYAGEAWPVDWDDWTEHFQENYRECKECGAYVENEFVTCGNCLARLPETKEENDDDKGSDLSHVAGA